jgi:hypothetical protein
MTTSSLLTIIDTMSASLDQDHSILRAKPWDYACAIADVAPAALIQKKKCTLSEFKIHQVFTQNHDYYQSIGSVP